jgi:hypothetical protein
MSEDQILRELGHLAKEEGETERARLDERWDRLAAETLTPEEDAELQALAATSPEARETYEAFRPLGPDFQARMIEGIAAELEKPVAPEKPRSRVLPFRPFWRPAWLTAAAAAAAVLLLLLRSPATMPPLPEYKAELSGGVKTFRGEEVPSTEPPTFIPGSTLTLFARPQHPVKGQLEARFFLSRVGRGDLEPWKPEEGLDMANGVVRFRGKLGQEIKLPPGTWTIWIVACRLGKVPPVSVIQTELRTGSFRHAACRAASKDLRVAERASP